MTIMDEVTSPASASSVSSVLPDRHNVPLREIPATAVKATLDRFLSSAEASVPVAAFNSSI
jgi:FXSXX-COOH protein